MSSIWARSSISSSEMSRKPESSVRTSRGVSGTGRSGDTSRDTGGKLTDSKTLLLELCVVVAEIGVCGLSLIVDFSGTAGVGFGEQAGATGLLTPKRLLVGTGRVVITVTVARLPSLFTGGTHVVKHSVCLVRMLVRIGGLLARVWSLVKLHADVVVLEELNSDTVNVTSGLLRPRRSTV